MNAPAPLGRPGPGAPDPVSSQIGLSLPIFEPAPAAPASAPHATRRLIDSHGRTIRDLRLSITDRCNFRCVYCMEPDTRFMPQDDLLSVEELVRLAQVCVGLGVDKVRITGGEPTVHPRLEEIIAGVAAIGGIDVAMTTNGSLIDVPAAERWRRAGLSRITVSLDSVSAERFHAMTRANAGVGTVLGAICAARQAGLGPVKVNAVVIRGINEGEIVGLAGLARDMGVEVRFIEFMPLDAGHAWDASKLVPASEIVDRIQCVHPLVPSGRVDASSTALHYAFADGAPGRIGVIAPVTRPFCGACSRLRITADGKVRPCLFSLTEWDVRPLLRGGSSCREIEDFLIDVTWTKQAGHGIMAPGFTQPRRSMSAIGG